MFGPFRIDKLNQKIFKNNVFTGFARFSRKNVDLKIFIDQIYNWSSVKLTDSLFEDKTCPA